MNVSVSLREVSIASAFGEFIFEISVRIAKRRIPCLGKDDGN